jgi:hypothetical protein
MSVFCACAESGNEGAKTNFTSSFSVILDQIRQAPVDCVDKSIFCKEEPKE